MRIEQMDNEYKSIIGFAQFSNEPQSRLDEGAYKSGRVYGNTQEHADDKTGEQAN